MSVIVLNIYSDEGEQLAQTKFHVDFGTEHHTVAVILSADDACDHPGEDLTARQALDEAMAEELAMHEGYDA